MKKVAVIGGGISGVFASIKIKELHPDYEVTIFEHNDKLLKKIYATGNGKCNFANIGSLKDKYHNEEFALPILNEFDAKDIISYFSSIGIESKTINDLVYPYSESAETVANKLLEKLESLNINSRLNSKVIGYNNNKVITEESSYEYDILIISVGGKSSSQLGSDGSLYEQLVSHGYSFKEASPSLCPIKTKENTKLVEGLRNKSLVSLYQNNKLIHQEEGELLFKKDGLSGMVIFNTTHYINRLDNKKNITIHIDFAPNKIGDIYSLVQPKLAGYLLKNSLDFHNTVFTFKDFYDFKFSQVTSGGIKVSDINNNLSSKKEKNVYFIGEVIDVDAVCGGYNIMWALASAFKVANSI